MSIVDESPGFYLFLSAFMTFLLGRELQSQQWSIAKWQSVAGATVFLSLVVRRLLFSPPSVASHAMEALFRSACFSMLAYGLFGIVAIVAISLASSGTKTWRNASSRWQSFQRNRRQAADEARRRQQREEQERLAALPRTAEEIEHLKEIERWERQQEEEQRISAAKREADRQLRSELELKMKLKIQLAVDAERKKELERLMAQFTDSTLPIDQFERRIEMIEESIQDFIPKANKNYRSIEHVLEDYTAKIQQVTDSDQTKEQKDYLRAILAMERDSMIQEMANQ